MAFAFAHRSMPVSPQDVMSVTLTAKVNPLREWPGFSHFLDGLLLAGLPDS